jgi:hypothetical protein
VTEAGGRGPGLRPVWLAWLFLAAVTRLPYLQAALDPPPGKAFTGFFYFADDHYNYLSFVQQAADGRFFLRNKLVLEPHAPALVNLEWWAVGRLSALLGGRPRIAYHLFGLAAAFALAAGVDLWLQRAGLPPTHRLPALLLVLAGGGLGGFAYLSGLLSPHDAIDVWTGLFPFAELLLNPHFVMGTALLIWTVAALVEGHHLAAAALGTVLALVRPYDFVLATGIHALGVLATEPATSWMRRLLPLLSFAPAGAYLFWVFYRHPAFSFYAATPYDFPSRAQLACALGPALALAAVGVRAHGERRWTRPLMAWAAVAGVVVAVRPVHFSLQFLVGVGVPLLALGALGLSRRRPWVLALAAALMSGTAAASLRLVTPRTHPRWHVPAEHFAAVGRLAPHCREGDLAVLPRPLGIYAGGLTACHPYTSHPIEPNHARRVARTDWFYEKASPAERERLLDEVCARLVVDEAGVVHERARSAMCGGTLD